MTGIEDYVWSYYNEGFSIIPLKEKDKRPNISSWEKYQNQQPTEEEIKEWLKKDLFKNIGIVCGAVSNNLVVIDVDDGKIISEIRLKINKIMDNGQWVVKTGRGWHIYCRHTSDPGRVEKDNGTHLEYRGNGGYVVAPPSIHPSGAEYHFFNREHPKQLLSLQYTDAKAMYNNMVEKVRKKRGLAVATTTDAATAKIQKGVPQGSRNDTAFTKAAKYQRSGLTRTETTDLLFKWNRKNKPPLPDSEIIQVIRSAYRYEKTMEQRKALLTKHKVIIFKKITDSKTKKERWIPGDINNIRLAKAIMELDYYFKRVYDEKTGQDDIIYYQKGLYKNGGEEIIRGETDEFLGDLATDHRRTEALKHIKYKLDNRIERSELEPEVKYINLNNGFYNIETKKLLKHTPDMYFINKLPVDYIPGADCPKIKQFFKEVLYEEDIPLIQEMFGYCLYRKYSLHVAFVLFGYGRNGKGVTAELLSKFVGNDNYSTRKLHDLEEDKFAKGSLYGRMINIGGEISSRKIKDSGEFKNLTGGEPITGERKYKGDFNFYNYAKLVFNANTLPDHDDKTHAFYQRWIIIPYPKTYDRGGKNTKPELINDLTTPEELSGLFNWALEGLNRLLENSDFTYETEIDGVPKYEHYRQPDISFITTYFEEDQSREILTTDAYEHYQAWAKENKQPVSTKTQFTQSIKDIYPDVKIRTTTHKGINYKFYQNIVFTTKGMEKKNHAKGVSIKTIVNVSKNKTIPKSVIKNQQEWDVE